MNDRYKSRKFLLAASAQVCAHAALWFGQMSPEIWFQTQSVILALYGASDVAEQKVNPEKHRYE